MTEEIPTGPDSLPDTVPRPAGYRRKLVVFIVVITTAIITFILMRQYFSLEYLSQVRESVSTFYRQPAVDRLFFGVCDLRRRHRAFHSWSDPAVAGLRVVFWFHTRLDPGKFRLDGRRDDGIFAQSLPVSRLDSNSFRQRV